MNALMSMPTAMLGAFSGSAHAGFFGSSFAEASLLARSIAHASVHTFEAMARSRTTPTAPHAAMRARAKNLQAFSRALLDAHRIELRIVGATPDRPSILVSNHLGYLDPVALASIVPCMPIAKREVDGWPIIGVRARALGVCFVRRNDAMSGAVALRAAARALRAGVSVLNFPEGTTTRGDAVLPFKRGIFGLACQLSAPVTPISVRFEAASIAWVGDDPLVPHYLRVARRVSTRITLHLGETLDPRAFSSPEQLAIGARKAIVTMNEPHPQSTVSTVKR